MKRIFRFLLPVILALTSTNPSPAQWTQTNGPCGGDVYSLAVSRDGAGGTNLVPGTREGVFLSTNNGTNWTQVNTGLTVPYVRALAFSGTNLFAGTGEGVFLSTNKGTSWTPVNSGLMNSYVYALALSGTSLLAGTSGGVFLSTNNGTRWTAVNTGLTNNLVYALMVSGTSLIAGVYGGRVWRRPLSEMITSVEVPPTNLPAHFSLSQNYPNTFNPTTTIAFGLPSKSFVSLKVFDALGREVATLISQELSAGNYVQQWNAADLPSGVYFCRLEVGPLVDTKKVILLR